MSKKNTFWAKYRLSMGGHERLKIHRRYYIFNSLLKVCTRWSSEHATLKSGALAACFKLKDFDKWQAQKGLFDLLFSPEAGHVTLM